MLKYGSDKPDLRNPLEIVDVTDVFEKISDLSAFVDEEEIADVYSLIDNTRRNRDCGICEAIVESALRILEVWCKKAQVIFYE